MFKIVAFIVGFALLMIGMTVVLREWLSVVTVFKGVIGPLLAVAGMVILFASTLKNHD